MRILMLVNHELTLYNFRREFIRELLNKGYEVYISMPLGEYTEYFKREGCKIIPTKLSRYGTNPFADVMLFLRYLRIIPSVKPDVVLTYTIKPNTYGGMACTLLRKRYIATITGLGAAFQKSGLIVTIAWTLYKLGLAKAQKIFFQNQAQLDLFKKHHIGAGKYEVVSGSGVNLDKHSFEPYPSGKGIKFVFVGRVAKDKGIDELIQAIGTIKEKYPNTTLNLVGNYEDGYEHIMPPLIEQGLLTFDGRQENVHSFISQAHAMVMPTYHEGMNNALQEAAACGRPVIATDIPGCQEIFDDGMTGIGFKPRDVQALLEALERFIQMPYEHKKDMGIAGRKKMEAQFDRNKVLDAYMQEIEKAGNKA